MKRTTYNVNKETIKYLIKRGAPPPYDIDQFIDDKPFFEFLLSKGAKSTLCGVKDVETAKYLLSKGADINYDNCSGLTLIESIIRSTNGNMDVINFLIENGAKAYIRLDYIPAWQIFENGNVEMLEYALSKGVNFDEVFDHALSNPTHYREEIMSFVHKHTPRSIK